MRKLASAKTRWFRRSPRFFFVTLVLSCRSTFNERGSGTAKVEVEFFGALGVLAECIGDDATVA